MAERLSHLNVEVTPEEARRRLAAIGINTSLLEDARIDWGNFGSHELRSLYKIYTGGVPRNLAEMEKQERESDRKKGRY